MSDTPDSSFNPAASVAAPALRKRFFEAHRFLSRVAQFPLVMAKLQRDGLEHPQFFAAIEEILPVDRLCFCIQSTMDFSKESTLWTWGGSRPPETSQAHIPENIFRSLTQKPLRFNDCHHELDAKLYEQGRIVWGEQARSVLSFPLHLNGSLLGVLLLSSRQAMRYNDGDFAHAQFLADALAPLAANRLFRKQHLVVQSSQLKTLEMERVEQQDTLLSLQATIDQKNAELEQLREELQQIQKERFDAQKRLQASQNERERLNTQLRTLRDERISLRQVCEQLRGDMEQAIEDGESLRQHLLHTHRSASMLRQLAEQRIKNGMAVSLSHTELILDASSQMMPEARNSLNHLGSLQEPSFGSLNSRQQRFVRFSLRSNRYILQLLSELNVYTRCMLGKLEVHPEPVSLSALFEDVRVEFASHIKQKRLHVLFEVDDAVGTLLADAYICRQLLHALLEHAVDATPISGAVLFTVVPSDEEHLQIKLEHDSELELLQEEALDRLFVPFQRPDFDPDDDIPPGLALALARELTLLHQGDISVEQSQDKLTFSLTWPKQVEERIEGTGSAHTEFTPLIELPRLSDDWEQPFGHQFEIPGAPTLMASSEFLPVSSSRFDLPSFNSPQPPRSLSSPSLPALPLVPPENIIQQDSALSSPIDAFLVTESLDSELDSFLPPEKEPSVDLTPPPVQHYGSSPSMPSPYVPSSDPSLSLEAELDLEDHSPTQIIFDVGLDQLAEIQSRIQKKTPVEEEKSSSLFDLDAAGNDGETSNIFEVDSIDGETSFILEELEDAFDLAPADAAEEEDVFEEDFEIEGLIDEPEFLVAEPTGPKELASSLLYLSDTLDAPSPSLFSLLDSWGFGFKEAESIVGLKQELKKIIPSAAALISSTKTGWLEDAVSELERLFIQMNLPLFAFQQSSNEETAVQMHWKGQSSLPKKESFWLGWLDRIRHPQTAQPRRVLSIGFDMKENDPSRLLRFCCGEEYELLQASNPASGVQRLYEMPPDLLLIQLDEPLSHWGSLFDEVGRSGRTRDIPILLFSQGPLEGSLLRALEPLHYLHLFHNS